MPNERSITRDRRLVSRVPAQLSCRFTFNGATRLAVVDDLSLRGALLSSKFLPPKGSAVTISIETAHTKKPLVLAGTVVRGLWGLSEQGEVSRFGVLFNGASPGLLGVLHALISNGKDGTPSKPEPSR